MNSWDDAFAYVVGEEGVLSMDPNDPGNWTGGKVGVGTLNGTKYGISAASFPTLDIKNLSLTQAKLLAYGRYWEPLDGDSLQAGLALGLFDCGYNQGIGYAVRCLQECLGLTQDGVMGPQTLIAARKADQKALAIQFTAARIVRYTESPLWQHDGVGWTRRAVTTFARMISV